MKGQETQDAYDKFDYELCGHDIPHYVVSDGPRLAMVFSSGELQARGFKVKIQKISTYAHMNTNKMFAFIVGEVYIWNGI